MYRIEDGVISFRATATAFEYQITLKDHVVCEWTAIPFKEVSEQVCYFLKRSNLSLAELQS